VLGADDGGEANLTYRWAMLTGPTGETVLHYQRHERGEEHEGDVRPIGELRLRVNHHRRGRLSVTSDVGVTVGKTLTSIRVTTAPMVVAPGWRVQYRAQGLDQFNILLPQQPAFFPGGWWPGRTHHPDGAVYVARTTTSVNAVLEVSSQGVTARTVV